MGCLDGAKIEEDFIIETWIHKFSDSEFISMYRFCRNGEVIWFYHTQDEDDFMSLNKYFFKGDKIIFLIGTSHVVTRWNLDDIGISGEDGTREHFVRVSSDVEKAFNDQVYKKYGREDLLM